MRTILVLLFAASLSAQQLKVPDAATFVGGPQGSPIGGEMLERRTTEISALLRCPVCQGLSVADSPSEMAVNMKGQVRELLARGYTEDQIVRYFELSYGQFVLLKPKNPFVWILPPLALVIGIAIVWMKLRKLEKAPAPAPPANPEEDAYLTRVRELVGGGRK